MGRALRIDSLSSQINSLSAKTMQLIAAPFTPFQADGGLNLSMIQPMAKHLKQSGVDGVFVNGTTGECASLTFAERFLLTEQWMEAGRDAGLKVMIHVGDNSLTHAEDLAAHAADQGASAVGVMAPYFFKPADVSALVQWVECIAGRAKDCPVYYYHIPGMTGVELPVAAFIELALERIPNFRGIKYSQVNPLELLSCLQRWDQQCEMFYGSDETMLQAVILGAHGVIGSSYNFAAPLYRKLIAAYEAGNLALARKLQQAAADMIGLLAQSGYLPATKQLMKWHGLDLGPVRLPLTGLAAGPIQTLCQTIDSKLQEAMQLEG